MRHVRHPAVRFLSVISGGTLHRPYGSGRTNRHRRISAIFCSIRLFHSESNSGRLLPECRTHPSGHDLRPAARLLLPGAEFLFPAQNIAYRRNLAGTGIIGNIDHDMYHPVLPVLQTKRQENGMIHPAHARIQRLRRASVGSAGTRTAHEDVEAGIVYRLTSR